MRIRLCAKPWAVAGLLAAAGCYAGQPEEPPATAEIVFAPPGAEAYPEPLQQKLRQALAGLGADYSPRTRHLREDGSPEYCNRLLLETSPYLRQHAHNPVNWYPWGEEAFDTARRLGRPVLLSIGYSTCHWCHVMEEESFEDEEIAAYLNANYIAIKVDREERPDIDAIYMKAVQMLTGRGGWPMTTWLTPAAQPFYGGTYFPARDGDRGSRQGFLTLLRELKRFYDQQPDQAAERAAEITQRLQTDLAPAAGQAAPGEETLARAMQLYTSSFDRSEGGLNRAPKFPSSFPLLLLLRESWRTGDARLREMARLTLSKMAAGGIYDQVGGGFHRYSVDSRWLVPPFEKMLYDNALLVPAYLEAYQESGDPSYARVADEVLQYALREMRSPEGGFYSATDADSLNPRGEREEGWFFTWTPDEIRAAVGAGPARILEAYYGVSAEGNFEGRNILHVARPLDEVAAEAEIGAEQARRSLAQARDRMYRARQSRPAPLLDDKVLTAWNGLMISALSRGGFVLGQAEYVERAEQAAGFLFERLHTEQRLLRSYHEGRARFNAYLNDYTFLIAGLIDLYQAGHDARWLGRAVELQAVLDRHYWDASNGGYFMTSDDHEALLTREKPAYDGAEPSGNSVALMNLVRLEALTLDDSYRQRADAMLRTFGSRLQSAPTGLSEMLLALQFRLAQPREIVLVTPRSQDQARPFLDVLRKNHLPDYVLVVAVEGADLEAQTRWLPALAGKVAREGMTTAYVCRQGVCRLPVTDPAAFAAQVSARAERTSAADPEK